MFTMRDLIPWSRGRDVEPGKQGWDHPLVSFQRDMDRLFEDLWRGFDLPTAGRGERRATVSPRIDVQEKDEAVIVTAELPGMDEKDVEVVFSDNVLTLKGEKKAEHEEKEQGYVYTERSFGSFLRRIPLATEIVDDKVDATFKNGVLTVTLPKSPEAQKHVKRIPIRGSAEGKEAGKKAA